ncbi:hypothetical protein [Streptomyces sp. NBC_01750]|uniref:hypothetical protein n=1 Tax=Streptomyces sp. NBC_01750 TaxID=2975928 RepID=UPI002DD98A3D|nr:hypothetical protein [Streptomyces sp. NBC_01750]WSD33181.1 hypothetical protein OG966_15460 [Streptomyces sp. NBC_01750]
MSFEEEWAQHKSEATTRMQLNHVDDGNGGRGGGQRLHVTYSVLMGRADKADTARGDFVDADNKVMTETGQVGASLKGFKSGPAFATFITRWKKQVSYVEGLLKNDVAGALRASAADFEVRDKDEADRYKNAHKGKNGGADDKPDLK